MSYCTPSGLEAIGLLFPILGTIAVAGRFYVTQKKEQFIHLDDWISIPAIVITAASGLTLAAGAFQDIIGTHEVVTGPEGVDDTQEDQIGIEKYQTALNPLIIIASALIKLSLLFYYQRVFEGKYFYWVNWGTIVVMALYGFIFPIAYLSACGSNLSAQWGTLEELEANCVDIFTIMEAADIINFIGDLFTITIPFVMIFKMKIPKRRKLQASPFFIVGSLPMVSASMKLTLGIFVKNYQPGTVTYILGVVTTGNVALVSVSLFWAYMEVGSGMVIACLPMLRAYFVKPKTESKEFDRSKISTPLEPNSAGGYPAQYPDGGYAARYKLSQDSSSGSDISQNGRAGNGGYRPQALDLEGQRPSY